VLILPTFDVLSNFWNLLSSLTSRTIDKMNYLLAALANFRKGSVEYEKDAVTVEGVRVCPEFRHDRLNNPSSWPGYKEFIAAIPPERGQPAHGNWSDHYESPGLLIDSIASFEDHCPKHLFYAAFHFPATSAGGAKVSQSCQNLYTLPCDNKPNDQHIRHIRLQMETIYRWELILAWESLRQVALTRTCLLLMTQREPPHPDWVRPNATILTALWEWVSLVSTVSGHESLTPVSALNSQLSIFPLRLVGSE
jgi:hypothetical protein